MTFREVEESIAKKSCVILPLGGLEPVGDFGVLGLVQYVMVAISNCVSERCDMLLAPVLSYGKTSAYRSFGGCIGIKKNIFESVLRGFIDDCVAWGTKRVFILDGTFDSFESVALTINKMSKKRKHAQINMHAYNWQREGMIRSFLAKNLEGKELGRSEFGLLSIASYINPSLIKKNDFQNRVSRSIFDRGVYKTWLKRGMDPEKFRKLSSDCRTSDIDQEPDPEFGKKLLEYIVTFYVNTFNNITKE